MIRAHLTALLGVTILVALIVIGVHAALSGLDHIDIGGSR